MARRLLPWVLRVLWATLPLTAGPALAAALDHRSGPVQAVAAILLWVGWVAVLLATLVPHPVGLTVLRMLAPAGLAVAIAGVLSGEPTTTDAVLAVVPLALTTALAFAPETGLWSVNGPAYPNERRYPLRIPAALLFGPVPLAWALSLGGPAAGLLLLAAKQWVAGAIVLVLGNGATFVLARALHGLSRRWVVFVPAGLVLHDPMALADPVLFPRRVIETLRPAPADTDSLDLTQRAAGLALELVLKEKVPMVLVGAGRRAGEAGASARLLFTPTRPGAVLRDAGDRRLPVG